MIPEQETPQRWQRQLLRRKEAGAEVDIKKVAGVKLDDLGVADTIILGSLTHFGAMSEDIKWQKRA